MAVGRDITQRKASEDEIHHLAFYDPLTSLPNRQLLLDRLGGDEFVVMLEDLGDEPAAAAARARVVAEKV